MSHMQRLRSALYEIDERAGNKYRDLPLLSVSVTKGIVRHDELFPDRAERAADRSHYKTVEPNDIVLNKMSAASGAVGLALEKGVVSPDYAVFRPFKSVHPRYVFHSVKGRTFLDRIFLCLRGIGVGASNARTPRVSPTDYLNEIIYLPPLASQRAIADYLDRETGEIDAMLAKLEGLAGLLEERRRNAITSAFYSATTAELWHYCEINPITDEFNWIDEDTEITFMPLETIWHDTRADLTRTIKWSKNVGSYTQFRSGDVLLPKITPTFEAGRAMVADIPFPVGLATTEVHVVRAIGGKTNPTWLSYAFQTTPFLKEGEAVLQGVGNLRRISPQWLRSFRVPVMSYLEQERIVAHLDDTTAQIDRMIAKAHQLRDLLTERRSALITAAVTGQVEIG